MRFVASTVIWFCLFLPMVLISFFVVPIMCLTKWGGKSTWFGNIKYGRGDTHYKAPSEGKYWKQVRFLCIRNPVSNFGKKVLSVKESATLPWLIDKHIYNNFYWMYGWKLSTPETNGNRTFVYRPWVHRK